MEKIESFNETIDLMKQGAIVTLENGNYFVCNKDKIISYFNQNRVVMSLQDFIELYAKENFYLYEDNSSFIDPLKDEEYYAFKHK